MWIDDVMISGDFTDQINLRPNPADNFGGKCAYFRADLLGILETLKLCVLQ